MADVVVNDQNFENEVLQSKTPVLVDFWAPWCAPCRIIGPFIEELAREYEGKITVGKLNVDDNPETAGRYNVMSIPTVMFFQNGQPVKTLIGAQRKENYKEVIEELLRKI